MIKQSFIVVQRREDFERVYQCGDNLFMAICYQKALIASDEITSEILDMVKELITQEDVDIILENLNNAYRDRLSNDEEEVYIIAFPKRENM